MLVTGSLVIKLSMTTINNYSLSSLITTLPNVQLKLLSWELPIQNVSTVLMTNQSSILNKKIVLLVPQELNSIPKLTNVNQQLQRNHPNVLLIMFGMKPNKNVSVQMLSQLISDVNVLPVWIHLSGMPMSKPVNWDVDKLKFGMKIPKHVNVQTMLLTMLMENVLLAMDHSNGGLS